MTCVRPFYNPNPNTNTHPSINKVQGRVASPEPLEMQRTGLSCWEVLIIKILKMNKLDRHFQTKLSNQGKSKEFFLRYKKTFKRQCLGKKTSGESLCVAF